MPVPGCKGWALSPYVSPLAHQASSLVLLWAKLWVLHPQLASLSSEAKILHFNGRLKPSHQGFRGCDPVKPPSRQLGEAQPRSVFAP